MAKNILKIIKLQFLEVADGIYHNFCRVDIQNIP